jgi:hypothetical protein
VAGIQPDFDSLPPASPIAGITDRSSEFTALDVRKTDATFGSRTTATVPAFISAANRLGRDLR